MAAAGGEWLAFVDADDVLPPDALANVACTGRRRGGYPLRRIYHSAIRTRADAKKCWPAPTAIGRRCWRALSAPTARSIPCAPNFIALAKIREKGLCVPPGVKVGEDVLFNLDAFYAARTHGT